MYEAIGSLQCWKGALITLLGTMNAVTGSCLALRVLDTVLHMRYTRQKTAMLMTLTWLASTTLLTGLCVKAWAAEA